MLVPNAQIPGATELSPGLGRAALEIDAWPPAALGLPCQGVSLAFSAPSPGPALGKRARKEPGPEAAKLRATRPGAECSHIARIIPSGEGTLPVYIQIRAGRAGGKTEGAWPAERGGVATMSGRGQQTSQGRRGGAEPRWAGLPGR